MWAVPGNDGGATATSTDPTRRRGRQWPFVALRTAAAVQAALVFAQAVLAGQLLSGNAAARAIHQQLGTEVITLVALLQVVLALMVWRPGRGPAWPIAVAAVTAVAVPLQIGMGFAGSLDVHIPLGVTILAVNLALAIGLRRPAPAA